MSEKIEEAEALAKSEKCDILFISGNMYPDVQERVISLIRTREKKPKKLFLILTTPGGLPDCAYRISRAIQRNYEHYTIIIPGWCKSAGTLCAIGAKDIVMFDEAEIGPIDVQLAKRDEIDERDSGLVIQAALDKLQAEAFDLFENSMLQIKRKSDGLITFKMATEIAATITKGLFEPLYRQLDPIKIGETARSLSVAVAYGHRLNLVHRNLKSGAIHQLTTGYPAHGFVIDRRETKDLFQNVREPNDFEKNLIKKLGGAAIYPPDKSAIVNYLNEEAKHETSQENQEVARPSLQHRGPRKGVRRKRKPRKSTGNSGTGA